MEEDEPWTSGAAAESSSEQPSGRRGGGVHYLAKCVLKGSAVLHAVQGHLRSPSSLDVVLGKETSIELVVVGEDGVVQSLCEQPVFGIIKDLAIIHWNGRSCSPKEQGKDLLAVLSDSGKLAFLTFCTEMDRFLPVTHVQLSKPGNLTNQLGRMLAVDSKGCFIAVSAYDDQFVLLSMSTQSTSSMVDKKIFYPPETEGEASLGKGPPRTPIRPPRTTIHGTIWSMCFISKGAHQLRQNPVLALVMHRKGAVLNDLVLFGSDESGNTIYVISQFSEPGPLALSVTEVPHICGFAVLFRMGDVLLMDLSDPSNPCCMYRTSLNFPIAMDDSVDESCRSLDVDDEGISARALLELRDSGIDTIRGYDPMCIDSGSCSLQPNSKLICSWSWEPTQSTCSRLIICLDTGELCMMEIHSEPEGVRVNINGSLYKGSPCKALLWVQGGLIAAFVEMGDGIVLKLENGRLIDRHPIQNIAPILDTSLVDYHDEKQDQMFAGCGVGSEGSLRIIRSGISVEKLLRTAPIYKGVTGIWTLQMKESDYYHSFFVLSFVEETRVLSVGLSFVDVSDAVGFKPDACTVACGLLADGLLVQVHRAEVRLCLPTSLAHPEGIPLSAPICTSWCPDNMAISLGAVGQSLIVVATSNPSILFILGVRSLSAYHYEIFEVQRVRLHYEVSCISLPRNSLKHENLAYLTDHNHEEALPTGIEIGRSFVVGTHKPSVEVLSLIQGGIKTVAVGIISINNASGIPLIGCIPEAARLVLVDRCYIIAGLRNGMVLRFEWPENAPRTISGFPSQAPFFAQQSRKADVSQAYSTMPSSSCVQYSPAKMDNSIPVSLQLIAVRRIGITPVFLVPLSDSLDSDIIALSDRPWLLQSAKHSLAYTSISFQPATHVAPVISTDCPKGILFIVENSLHLVEMVQSKRLNVQKFHLGGTPRKVLYHNESKTLLVMRTGPTGDSCSSDICRIDPVSGSLLSRYKFEPGETAKCMQIVKVGNEQFLIVGTSQTAGHAIMPSGEAESATGRVLVITLENTQNSDSSSLIFCPNSSSSSQLNSPFREIVGYATEQLSSSSLCSSSDDNNCDGKHEECEGGQLKLVNAKTLSGVVLSVCPYLDRYFLVSAGNILFVFGFLNNDPRRMRRFASARTRFAITCLTTYLTRIAVGDCRDGVLFYSYQEDKRKLEQLYCDPMQRLIADCILMDLDTAVATDRRGIISILSSTNDLEDSASPERNLIPSCSFYMGETAMSIRKGSFSYGFSLDDGFKCCDGDETTSDTSNGTVVASTLLGSVMVLIPVKSEVYEVLKIVQNKLAVHPLTAPILGNDLNEFRGRGSPAGNPVMLDGDMLAQFLEFTNTQQELLLATISPQDTGTSATSQPSVSVCEVVQMLERIHYALN